MNLAEFLGEAPHKEILRWLCSSIADDQYHVVNTVMGSSRHLMCTDYNPARFSPDQYQQTPSMNIWRENPRWPVFTEARGFLPEEGTNRHRILFYDDILVILTENRTDAPRPIYEIGNRAVSIGPPEGLGILVVWR